MQHFGHTLAFNPFQSIVDTISTELFWICSILDWKGLNLYHPSAHFVSSPSPPPLAPGCLSTPPASFSPLTLSGFFNGMLAVSKPGARNCYTIFRLIPLTLFVSRNLTLTHLPLSRSLDSLLCNLIALTTGLAISLS